jgi:hypothetical protein
MMSKDGVWRVSGYYLNFTPSTYYGLKRFALKARFMILILTI